MLITEPTIEELTRRGRQALCQELGVAGAIRFMQISQPATGNYTEESRDAFADQSLDDLISAIKARR